jgi:hypothetical protein
MSKQQRAHFEASEKIRHLVQTMRLAAIAIDHQKSWHWSTSKPFLEMPVK